MILSRQKGAASITAQYISERQWSGGACREVGRGMLDRSSVAAARFSRLTALQSQRVTTQFYTRHESTHSPASLKLHYGRPTLHFILG